MTCFADALAALQLTCIRTRLEQTPQGNCLWVWLDRPQAYNAISMELLTELHRLLDLCAHLLSLLSPLPPDFPRVLVLGGSGRAFSGGVDIKAAKAGVGGAGVPVDI